MTIDLTTGTTYGNAQRARERLMRAAEDRMRDFLAAEGSRFGATDPRASVPVDATAELIAAGGKRIRPSFCITGYLAAGGDPERADMVVSAAVALELLHACALIHDDVMDASDQRRGVPTVHAKHSADHTRRAWRGESRRFGESVAILAGDLALIYSDTFMAGAPLPVSSVWAQLRSELIIGQYMDVAAAAEYSADPDLSRWIAVAKSGHYTIHRPLQLGATIAGRPDFVSAFETYGVAVGEAFQLRDDLLDAFNDAEVTGKPAGLDLEQHKMNLLFALATQRDSRLLDLVTGDAHDIPELRRLLVETGVRTEVEDHIGALVAKGCAAIDQLPLDQVWKDELVEMAHQVAYRDK